MRGSHFGYILLAGTLLSGCASSGLPPVQPAPPSFKTYAPPPPPPEARRQAPGPATDSRTYRVSVGTGDAHNGPQQVIVNLPPKSGPPKVIWPNKELLAVESAMVGGARGNFALFIKPLQDTGGSRVENVAIATAIGLFNIDVHIGPGRLNNKTLTLPSPEGGGGHSVTSAQCLDSNFTWSRAQAWAPVSVCVQATSDGVYSTKIQFASNIKGMQMPVAMGYRDLGDGKGSAMALNYRVEGTNMIADGMPNMIQLTGNGAPIFIERGTR